MEIFNKNKKQDASAPPKEEVSDDLQFEKVINQFKINHVMQFQDDYLQRNRETQYDYFGYYMDESETPYFESTDKQYIMDCLVGATIIPYTPALLEHCVKHLTMDALKLERKNIAGFKRKCEQIASVVTIIPKREWDRVIENAVNFVSKPHHLKPEQVSKLVNGLTLEQFEGLDWNAFGKQAKQFLPPSYNKRPANVDIHLGKDNVPRASISFMSTTTPSVRTLKIRKGDVSIFVNDSTVGVYHEELAKVWRDFCAEQLQQYAEPQEQKNVQHYYD